MLSKAAAARTSGSSGAGAERASRSCWLTPRITSQLEKTAASCSLVSACSARSGCRHFSQKSERSATLRRNGNT